MASRRTRPRVDPDLTFTLRITPERAPAVSRTIEFRGDDDLDAVHDAIQRHFDLDRDHLYAFFLSGKAWHRESAYYVTPTKGEHSTTARLKNLQLAVGRRFLYLFDFGDELRHGVEVVAVGRVDPEAKYPRLVESVGKAPPQYRGEVELGERLEALVGEFEDLAAERKRDGGETPPPPPTREQLMAELELARRVLPALEDSDLECLDVMYDELPSFVDWLDELPSELVDSGAADEGLSLFRALVPLRNPEMMGRFEEALLLGRSGRAAEGVALVDAALAAPRDVDDDEWDLLSDAGDALGRLGEAARGEELFRRSLALLAVDEPDWERELVVDGLAELLERTGRAEEAAALREAEADAARRAELDDVLAADEEEDLSDEDEPPGSPPAPAPTARRLYEGAARNAPCPCGSGKKYKKCHGAPVN